MSSQNVAAQEFGVTLFWDPVTAPPGLCHEGGMRKKERNVGTLKHGCSASQASGSAHLGSGSTWASRSDNAELLGGLLDMLQ